MARDPEPTLTDQLRSIAGATLHSSYLTTQDVAPVLEMAKSTAAQLVDLKIPDSLPTSIPIPNDRHDLSDIPERQRVLGHAVTRLLAVVKGLSQVLREMQKKPRMASNEQLGSRR